MANVPGIPLNQAELRYRYTAAQAYAEGSSDQQVKQLLRSTYESLTPQEILQYTNEGKQAYTLGQAYLAGDQSAINAAKSAMAPGAAGEYVLTVKVRLPDLPESSPGEGPEENWKTVRIVVQPGMTADDVLAALQAQEQVYEEEYEGKVIDRIGLSALAV